LLAIGKRSLLVLETRSVSRVTRCDTRRFREK